MNNTHTNAGGAHQMSVLEKIAKTKNLIEAIQAASEEFAESPAQKFKDDSKLSGEFKNERSYKGLVDEAKNLGLGLIEIGVPQESMISIYSENRPEWNISDYAILMNGCVTIGVYTNDSVEHIKLKCSTHGPTCCSSKTPQC